MAGVELASHFCSHFQNKPYLHPHFPPFVLFRPEQQETKSRKAMNDVVHTEKGRDRMACGKNQALLVVMLALAMLVTMSQIVLFHSSAVPDHQDVRQLEDFIDRSRMRRRTAPANASGAHTADVQQSVATPPLSNSKNTTATTANPFVEMLRKAGENVTGELLQQLNVVHKDWRELYGTEPVILGMETCEAFQQSVARPKRILAVAGLFNTGTNAMEYHLRKNIPTVTNKWQVPWGKHRVPRLRLHHVATGMDRVRQEDVLPIVIVRDPLHWMQSMCKSPYAAKWKKTKLHCPNLVPTENDKSKFARAIRESNNTFPVTVHFDKDQVISWPSLMHLYSDWYRQYLDADYPRLLVRFEDMLWQAPTVLDAIAKCVGAKRADPIAYQVKSSKGHGSGTGLVKAILKSGNSDLRHGQITNEDLEYARLHGDAKLLELFKYSIPLKNP